MVIAAKVHRWYHPTWEQFGAIKNGIRYLSFYYVHNCLNIYSKDMFVLNGVYCSALPQKVDQGHKGELLCPLFDDQLTIEKNIKFGKQCVVVPFELSWQKRQLVRNLVSQQKWRKFISFIVPIFPFHDNTKLSRVWMCSYWGSTFNLSLALLYTYIQARELLFYNFYIFFDTLYTLLWPMLMIFHSRV